MGEEVEIKTLNGAVVVVVDVEKANGDQSIVLLAPEDRPAWLGPDGVRMLYEHLRGFLERTQAGVAE